MRAREGLQYCVSCCAPPGDGRNLQEVLAAPEPLHIAYTSRTGYFSANRDCDRIEYSGRCVITAAEGYTRFMECFVYRSLMYFAGTGRANTQHPDLSMMRAAPALPWSCSNPRSEEPIPTSEPNCRHTSNRQTDGKNPEHNCQRIRSSPSPEGSSCSEVLLLSITPLRLASARRCRRSKVVCRLYACINDNR